MNHLSKGLPLIIALLAAGCGSDRTTSPSPSPSPSPPPAPSPTAAPASVPAPPAPLPTSSAPAGDGFARVLAYAEESAPYLNRAREIARDSQVAHDPARLAAALRADELMKHYPLDSQRMLARHRLTTADLATFAPMIAAADDLAATPAAEPPAPAARTALAGRIGEANVGAVERHADGARRLRSVLNDPTHRPIDCGRQPESCSCTECPTGCEIPGYTDCTFACVAKAAQCALESGGLAAVICAIGFQRCMDQCNALPCQ